MIKVSVIVPCYNTAKYLPKCIESLLAQTLKEIELIFVNDCSPDNSIEILREYESKYPGVIRVIDSPINLRQGGARNLGINAARGEYIGFVDSDDYVMPYMFEKLYNEGIRGDYDTVGSHYLCVDQDYNETKKKKINSFN